MVHFRCGVAITSLREGRKKLLDIFFPRFCLRCGQEGEAWCRTCDESYVLRPITPCCPFCFEGDTCRVCEACRGEVFLDGVVAIGSYADVVVQGALKHWKYYGDSVYRNVIEGWIRKGVGGLSIPYEPFVVSHIPLHVRKRRERGFDQAGEIAQMFAREFGLEHLPLLTRRVRTSSQAGKGRKDRIVGDMDHVFLPHGAVPEYVLLCDDVFTSGATMDAAAKKLKENGAKVVWGLTVARSGKA